LATTSTTALGRLDDTTRVAMLIAAIAIIRVAVATLTPMSGDEAYYWLWSRRLELSYFDHPGMVAYWIAASTALFGTSELGLRLPSVLAAAAVTWLTFDTARTAFPGTRAGWLAALWLNATILFAAAGIIITPDTPLLVFWMLALWALVRLLNRGGAHWMLVAGVALGLGFDSKYTMVLMAPGILATFLLFPAARVWWRRPLLYGTVVLAAVCTLPVVVWNARHDWASFQKQWAHGFADTVADPLKNLTSFLSAQFGVVTPLILLFCLWGLGWALWAGWRQRRPDWFLLGATSAPVLLFFAHHSLEGSVQAHWAGPAYLAGCIAAAGAWTTLGEAARRRWNAAFVAAPVLGAVMVAAVYLQAATAILPLPPKADALSRLGGWGDVAAAVEEQRQQHPGAFVIASKHELVGLLAFLMPGHPLIMLTGNAEGPRQLNYGKAEIALLPGRDGLFVVRAGSGYAVEDVGQHFTDLTLVRTVERRWGRRVIDRYEIYFGRDYRPGMFQEPNSAAAKSGKRGLP
jgi:4-amino-4-deoxy-L-arabinose transferase-like glycosyltransferase